MAKKAKDDPRYKGLHEMAERELGYRSPGPGGPRGSGRLHWRPCPACGARDVGRVNDEVAPFYCRVCCVEFDEDGTIYRLTRDGARIPVGV